MNALHKDLAEQVMEQLRYTGNVDPSLRAKLFEEAQSPTGRPARRKIEEKIAAAVAERRNFTTTRYSKVTNEVRVIDDNLILIFLHGNHIATVTGRVVVANVGMFDRWPTVTTASRLRSLGFDATIRQGEGHIANPVITNLYR